MHDIGNEINVEGRAETRRDVEVQQYNARSDVGKATPACVLGAKSTRLYATRATRYVSLGNVCRSELSETSGFTE